jgi:putative transposase
LLREAVRETVAEVLQTVLELDRTAFLQVHGGRRNGYYPRKLETAFGQVDLKVPRDRESRYYPAFLKPYARRLVDVGEVAVALYAAGVSQRKAAEILSLLLGHRYSHETLSALTDQVLEAAGAFRTRLLPEEMAFVYLDGLSLKVFREGEGIVRESVYVALGIAPNGERRVLGFWLLPTESALGWEGVLGELWQRGLRRVLLFVTDGLPGLPEAIRRVYPQAEWQRCVVHGVRWSLSQVRSRDRGLLAEDLRRVYGAESREEALGALEEVKAAWGSRYPGVVGLWVQDSGAFLRFYGYPKVLWPYLRSTNLMERFIREVRRGTKVRDHKFPKEEAVYKLLYLESERQEGRWAERKLKGFSEVKEVLEKMLQERYAPRTQTLRNCCKSPLLQLMRPWPAASPASVSCLNTSRLPLPQGGTRNLSPAVGFAPSRQRSAPPPTAWAGA